MTDKVFFDHLRERSREIAPDYPGISNDLEPWEHLWAITSSYEGTNMANGDCHKFIGWLCKKFGTNVLDVIDEFKSVKGAKL